MTWRIVEGDCVERMAAMEPCSVDAVVCDPPTGYWLAGLIDGEGCFRVQANRSRTRGVDTYATSFTLKLRDDDEPIIRTIIATIGLGRYAHDTEGRGRSRPCSIWVVDTREDWSRMAELQGALTAAREYGGR